MTIPTTHSIMCIINTISPRQIAGKNEIMSINWGNFTLLIYCAALARFRRKRKRTSSDGYYGQYIKLIMNIYKNLNHGSPRFPPGQAKPLIRTFPLNHANVVVLSPLLFFTLNFFLRTTEYISITLKFTKINL